MFKKAILSIVAASVCLMGSDTTILTEEYPPYNYMKDGLVTGFSTEIVKAMQERMEHRIPIEVLPWSRAYNLTLKRDGYALYSTTRNAAREDLFKWVGPLVSNATVFYAKTDSPIKITDIESAKQYKICAYKDDADEMFLKENNFPKIDSVIKNDLNVKKLSQGKCDLWIAGHPSGYLMAKSMGMGDKIKQIFTVQTTEMYMAFGKNTPDEEVARWQEAYDQVKAAGIYDKTYAKYFQ